MTLFHCTSTTTTTGARAAGARRGKAATGALLCTAALAACSANPPPAAELRSLSVGVAELELQLRGDPYRSFAKRLPDGRSVFDALRWQLERLQRERAASPEPWTQEDYVLEFARARTLERSHRYAEAGQAYERVGASGASLAAAARSAAEVMQRFAAQGALPPATASAAEFGEIDAQISRWQSLAQSQAQPVYAALAREEAETWEVLRVELLAHSAGSAAALQACAQLIEHHRESKLYPQHLLRLGDLHADAAHADALRARAQRAPLAQTPYQSHLDGALAAYEEASEARAEDLRTDAQTRLQALLSFHRGVQLGGY